VKYPWGWWKRLAAGKDSETEAMKVIAVARNKNMEMKQSRLP
jgi:hypothetical protein